MHSGAERRNEYFPPEAQLRSEAGIARVKSFEEDTQGETFSKVSPWAKFPLGRRRRGRMFKDSWR